MTVKEAIERLEFNWRHYPQLHDTSFAEAEKLGIEALERLEYSRREHILMNTGLLPSETKD